MNQNKTTTTALTDEMKPEYIFSLTPTELLSKAVHDHINLKELAYKELRNRGLDSNGKWIGFDKKTL